jgi:hypothetical protein
VDFRELCRRAIPPDARYLVLDLDRTVHLGRNMGELLGWEVVAYRAYGPEHLAQAEPRRSPGRFFLDWRRPLATVRYLWLGAWIWALPGLFYLFSLKIPGRFERGRRWLYRAFGNDPVAKVQRVPQTALMRQMAGVPAAELRLLARRVWERHAPDQVIEREDLDWLRERCPGLRILISSASPQPSVEVAAEALGADDVLFSTVEQHDGWYSAPHQAAPGWRIPRRISTPSETRFNSSHTKVERLRARYPDLADPATVSVGITDTGHGEDHCWMGYFTRVIDVNSPTPFPPIAPASSPLREVHSAAVLTRKERARRTAGDAAYLDRRRVERDPTDRVFQRRDLEAGLDPLAGEVERVARELEERETALAPARGPLVARAQALAARLEALVHEFNRAAGRERRAALARLRQELRRGRTLERELLRIERPLSDLACSLASLLAASRSAVGGGPGHAAR